MSAITGICDFPAMAGSASASSWLGTATRTMSHPAAVSSAICCRVALISVVAVVVIDCTLTGASPPTSSAPPEILGEARRGARTGAGIAGIPRPMGVGVLMPPLFHLNRTTGLAPRHRHRSATGSYRSAHQPPRTPTAAHEPRQPVGALGAA